MYTIKFEKQSDDSLKQTAFIIHGYSMTKNLSSSWTLIYAVQMYNFIFTKISNGLCAQVYNLMYGCTKVGTIFYLFIYLFILFFLGGGGIPSKP